MLFVAGAGGLDGIDPVPDGEFPEPVWVLVPPEVPVEEGSAMAGVPGAKTRSMATAINRVVKRLAPDVPGMCFIETGTCLSVCRRRLLDLSVHRTEPEGVKCCLPACKSRFCG